MLSTMRNRLGPVIVTLIVGGIAAIFILSDFISPRRGGGMGTGGVASAGEVDGESIPIAEYNRELGRRVEQMKQFTGGKFTDEQMKMFRVREGVFNELVQRRLVLRDCERLGLVPSDAEVMAKIRELPYFKKEGKFDLSAYRAVLAGNNLSPGGFEKMIRDDLTLQHWSESIRARVQVSEDELEREYRTSNDQRNIKYVVFDTETGRKSVQVPDVEVEAFVKDPARLARAKARFESLQATAFKGRKFEDVQKQLAREVLAGEKTEAIRDANLKAADQILPLLGQAPDAKVNATLKSLGATVKSSGLIHRQSGFIQGLGDAKDILADAFAERSPINPAQGGKARKYTSPAWVAVAVVAETRKPDLTKFAAEKTKLQDQLRMKKERALEEEWVQALRSKAKVEMNPALVSESEEAKP